MFSSSDLLQPGYAFIKLTKTGMQVEDGETEVNFSTANSTDAPLGIMIPKHLVPVVKWLWCEECQWLQKRPITPKWAMYTIQPVNAGLLNICGKLPRINSTFDRMEMHEGG